MGGLQVVGRPGGNRRSGEDLPEVARSGDAPEVVPGVAPEVVPLTTYDGEKLPVSVTAAPYGYQHSHSHSPSPAPPESQPLFYPPAHLQPGQYGDSPDMYGGSQAGRSTGPPNKRDGRICGMKRTLFLVLLAGGGLLLMGIAIGVGVGVGVGDKSDSDSAGATTSSSSAPSKTTATATATTSAPAAPTNCPDVGERTYTTKSGKKFLHTCGIDYAGEGEADDLTNAKTSTFDECIERCSTTSGCTGAGWEDLQYDGGDKYRRVCWMKNNLQKSHAAEMTYSFAALVE